MPQRIAAFEVLEPGILTTVQDIGRYGFSQFGVPPSGALDSYSFRIANLLVGNEEEEACLETMVMGLKLRARGDVLIAITGGDLFPTLNGNPSICGEPIFWWKAMSSPSKAFARVAVPI